jgi:hypothetical protein
MTYSGDRILLGNQRESQVSKFRPWVLFVIPALAILFNFYIPLFFSFLGFLDLPLLVTVYFALMRRSPISGTFIGAFIGLAQDSLAKNPSASTASSRRWSVTSPPQWGYGSTWTTPHPALARFSSSSSTIFSGAGPRAARPAGELQPGGTLVLGLNAVVALFLFHFLTDFARKPRPVLFPLLWCFACHLLERILEIGVIHHQAKRIDAVFSTMYFTRDCAIT